MSQDPYKYFRVEARELADALGRDVLALEKAATPELASRLLRLAHTLKGAARVVKHGAIAEQAHGLEEALAPLRTPGAEVPQGLIDRLLSLVDGISDEVRGLEPEAPREPLPSAQVVVDEPLRTVRVDLEEMDGLLRSISEAGVALGAARRALGGLDDVRRVCDVLVEQVSLPQATELARNGGAAWVSRARSVGEELRRLVANLARILPADLGQTELELGEVREAAERLRFLPASLALSTLERALRDAAQSLGKQAVFEASGTDVRIDAEVLSRVQGALVQLVRNAVAHGIEMPGERRKLGKPPNGTVRLAIVRRGSHVSFVCSDDGKGIDLEAVRQAARQRGLVAEEVQGLGAPELLELLMKGGLSTSKTVSHVAGRGIGLDVVREAASALGGDVSVHTHAGEGTRIELRVPVSIASVQALIVQANGTTAAIPLDAVRRTLRLGQGDVSRTADGDSIVYDGKTVSFGALAPVLGSGSVRPGERERTAVVVDGGAGFAAVGVDRVVGTSTVVLRPVPDVAMAADLVAGVYLDPEGAPELVLDPAALVHAVLGVGAAPPSRVAERMAPILVIDDSLTTRMLEQSILESAGYEVELATSAEDALEKAARKRYGLFLVDVEMPGMDGFSFIERTRADPELGAIPAILVSSRNSTEDLQRGARVGAHAYLVKTEFDQKKFLETIRGIYATP